MKNSLAIVVVNWNTGNILTHCLNSIKKYSPSIPYEVYVVDNNSSDNTVEIIKKKFLWVKLIVNKDNLGFGKANNQVLNKIKDEYVFILNPDIEFTTSTVYHLLNFLKENSDVAACAPIMLNKDRTIQSKGYYHRFPSLAQTLLFYTDLYKVSIKNKNLVEQFWENKIDIKNNFEVDQIPGACIFARVNKLREVGFFDKRYPLLFEDVDLSYKLKQKGSKLFAVPSSKVIHLGGESFKKLEESDVQIIFFRGLFIFFRIHKNILEQLLVKLIILLNLIYLITLVSIKRIIKPTEDKNLFIKNKWKVAKWLLVS
ncbi:MAG: glycosyltransferase family 2 protein [bacterium]|nr:glycosyltransferase family 2 protein [bacterium]